jgi:hypothetical protein
MAGKRNQNKVLLSVIEATEGVEQTVTPSTDACLVEDLEWVPGDSSQETNEHTNSLDPSEDVPIDGPGGFRWKTWLKGSGVAGTAPPESPYWKAAGFTELLTSSAIGVPTAATAGTTSTITLPASPFNGANDAYNGMIVRLSGNPATPEFVPIKDWVNATGVMTLFKTFGSALNASTMAQILRNVLYTPQSGTIPSLTQHGYFDGIKRVLTGARITQASLMLEAGKPAYIQWTSRGIFKSRTDTANPAVTFANESVPKLTWRNDNNNAAFLFDGSPIGVGQVGIEVGYQADNAPNPNQPQGFDVTDLGARSMKLSMNPRLTSIATRDVLGAKNAGTKYAIAGFMGISDGNRFAFTAEAGQPLSNKDENANGILNERIEIKLIGANRAARFCYF